MKLLNLENRNHIGSEIESTVGYPACRQLDLGWTGHHFDEPLESEFREVYFFANLILLRSALFIGFLFGLTVLAIDYGLSEPGFSSSAVLIRATIIQSLVLTMFLASFHPAAQSFLPQLGTAIGLSIAATLLLFSIFADGQTMRSAFTGYVVVTFYMYLFLGQRFWMALLTATLLLVSFLVATNLRGQATDLTIYGTYLVFINLICASGLYSYEHNHRRMFLETRKLKELANRDSLTGLANRRAFDEYLENTWLHAKRESLPIALALIDIDHFKSYNDNYGHQAGDKSLIAVARVIERAVRRPLDFTARYGGEEFVALFVGATSQDAERIINTVRLAVQALKIRHEGSPTTDFVTISAGLACVYPNTTTHSIQGFMQLADQALYQAKQDGRNRVYLSSQQEDMDTKTGLFKLNAIRIS